MLELLWLVFVCAAAAVGGLESAGCRCAILHIQVHHPVEGISVSLRLNTNNLLRVQVKSQRCLTSSQALIPILDQPSADLMIARVPSL